MKTLSFLLVIFFMLLTACEKQTSFKFGDTKADFVADSVYRTDSDGLLYVGLDASWSHFTLFVLADDNSEPETEIASIRWHGSITQPLERNTYWKITFNDPYPKNYVDKLVIRWTPIE